ncbi:type II secretion system minor pseudopilin GspH [Vibrio sp. Y2-5]|uniref:type II secretion system minor pseudopilin GspH n=1 Tax=Vibrio sp. Y2-5 TaxID=2743977 RepID=UPI001660D585|nr:type II secretion system minor pseudopilin GspH [Vibrio sp. Y2-5]MBD0787605.1 type II secretion system minor pseudopilin GspH [Vibrio sp. Y2-5]
MKQSRGFTLLEILLVLVLISVSAVAVIATFPVSQKNEAKLAAQSLFQRIQLINEEAILSGRDFGLRIDDIKGAFLFLELSEEGWKMLEKRQFGSELKLPSELVTDFQLGGNAWTNDERLFESDSLFDHEMFAEEQKQQPPQIFILSSGEVTPFVVSIHPKQSRADSWRIVVEENGQIRLFAPGEQDEKA